VALAAAENLAEPLVDQPIALTALGAGQQQSALIGFNGGHLWLFFELNRTRANRRWVLVVNNHFGG
jgi:hypothetical protein